MYCLHYILVMKLKKQCVVHQMIITITMIIIVIIIIITITIKIIKILSNIIIIKKNKNKNTDLWRVNQMMNDKTMMNSCTEDNCSGREPNYAS